MKQTLTRHILPSEIVFNQIYHKEKYLKNEFLVRIDKWKYFLKETCKAEKGQKILLAKLVIDVDYFALCFACFELSLKIVIVDYNRPDNFNNKEFIDPKTKLLSPIDILLYDIKNMYKVKFFKQCSKKQFDLNNVDIDNLYYEVIDDMPEPTDILMVCTSSGTTNTPKVIEHTHQFLFEISKRNSVAFSGNVVHNKNLMHGSSMAVYLLPSLMSADVIEHILVPEVAYKKLWEDLKDLNVNHLLIPYIHLAVEFFKGLLDIQSKWGECTISLLSYIPNEFKKYVEYGYVNKIESIFGSNETSGPTLLSVLNKDNVNTFTSKQFKKLDNFYDITLDENNTLNVGMPIYNTCINTNDVFKKDNELFLHAGRYDLIRINDVEINLQILEQIEKDCDYDISIITDTIENRIYLGVWDNISIDNYNTTINSINNKLANSFNTTDVFVSKHAFLNKDEFYSGVKLDKELCREHFRNV